MLVVGLLVLIDQARRPGEVGSQAEASAEVAQQAPTEPFVDEGDPLLLEARASLVGGRLSEAARLQLLESGDARHERARRLLAHMEGQESAKAPAMPASAARRPATTPSLVAPPSGSTAVASASAPVVSSSSSNAAPRPNPPIKVSSSAPATAATPVPTASAAPSTSSSPHRATMRSMSLRAGRQGTDLTLTAGHGLMVGIVKEPSRNTVRLLVDKASALPNVLSARPKAKGVRVTGIRRGMDTVQINLQLDPGWTVGRSRRTAGGATISFRPPANG